MRYKIFAPLFLVLLFIPAIGDSQTSSDYLILHDIGPYKLDRPEKVFAGEPPIGGPRTSDGSGIIGATGHFPDHGDKTYEIMYIGNNRLPSPTVQITKHAGSESDKWLLHEVERGFRGGEHEENMTPSRFRNIDGNNIFYTKLGGGTYRWINKNIVVSIEYTDLYQKKSEPLEVIKAYLTKFPSTIPAMSIEKTHNEKWIKDEMERRMWLADKWYMAFQTKKVKQEEMFRALTKNLEVFLNYREKYHKISAKDEKNALSDHLRQNNGTGIKNKFNELKKWWEENKEKEINLQ